MRPKGVSAVPVGSDERQWSLAGRSTCIAQKRPFGSARDTAERVRLPMGCNYKRVLWYCPMISVEMYCASKTLFCDRPKLREAIKKRRLRSASIDIRQRCKRSRVNGHLKMDRIINAFELTTRTGLEALMGDYQAVLPTDM